MKILLTNTRLDARGGTETLLRNWVQGLQELGHSVTCYSAGPLCERRPLATLGVPVSDDLERLPFVPDIIHGQHHLDAMAALTALPAVPALYVCHSAVWLDCPPIHPRIYKYLAVSDTLAQRLAVERSIPPSAIDVLLNSVDLARFATVRQLPRRPARALFFGFRHGLDSATVRAVRQATANCGVALDVVGTNERRIELPEEVLPTYDVVFASGVSALEALACGCALVVLGRTSCGELVAPENYERLRRVNFTIPVNSPPPDAAAIENQLRCYSAERCSRVSQHLRRDADYRVIVPKLVSLYEGVIDQHRPLTWDTRADLVATSRYLQTIVPLVAMCDAMLNGHWAPAREARSASEVSAALAQIRNELDSGR